MSKKLVDTLLFIENILGVYRNYCVQEEAKKIYIILHLILIVFLHTVSLCVQVYYLLPADYGQLNLICCGYASTAYFTYMSAVITAIWYQKAYTSYNESIKRILNKLEGHRKLSDSNLKAFWLFLFLIVLAISFSIFRSLEVNAFISRAPLLARVSISLSLCFLRVTIIFEYLMFFITNVNLITLCKYQNSLILAAQKRLSGDDVQYVEEPNLTKEEIQDWVDQYRDLVNCCQMVTKFCGGQFLFSLMASISHYILMTYQFFYIKAYDKEIVTSSGKISFILFGYLLVMMTPLFAGHIFNNQGKKYYRMLVRLYNTITIDKAETEGKLIKDFIRQLKKNPLQLQLVSGLPVGMSLLPITLSLYINYVIILLQFNHII